MELSHIKWKFYSSSFSCTTLGFLEKNCAQELQIFLEFPWTSSPPFNFLPFFQLPPLLSTSFPSNRFLLYLELSLIFPEHPSLSWTSLDNSVDTSHTQISGRWITSCPAFKFHRNLGHFLWCIETCTVSVPCNINWLLIFLYN